MTQDEQRQLDRMEQTLNSFRREQAAIQVEVASHQASTTRAHGLSELTSELQATRRDVVKLGAVIGAVTLIANGVAVSIIVRMLASTPS